MYGVEKVGYNGFSPESLPNLVRDLFEGSPCAELLSQEHQPSPI